MNAGYFMLGLTLLVFGSILTYMIVTYFKARYTRSDMKVREKKTGKVYDIIVETHYYILDCNGKIFGEYEGEGDEDFELIK